ncbi:MAG: CBS domain-containing protein [Actinomycetota bacterium]|nr:CBS domain-containing protein [Actinomycetota bacterium]
MLDGDRCAAWSPIATSSRALAEDRDPNGTKLGEICSGELVTISPGDDLTVAGRLMPEDAVRRLPVVEGGKPVGTISMGDLAVERDPDSPLAQVSAASPNT